MLNQHDSEGASTQVVETSIIVGNNSCFQNYTNSDDHTKHTTDTPGFKPFTVQLKFVLTHVRHLSTPSRGSK